MTRLARSSVDERFPGRWCPWVYRRITAGQLWNVTPSWICRVIHFYSLLHTAWYGAGRNVKEDGFILVFFLRRCQSFVISRVDMMHINRLPVEEKLNGNVNEQRDTVCALMFLWVIMAFSQRLKEDVFFLARWPLCKLPMLDLVSTSLSLSCNIACSCWKPFRSFKTVALTMVSRLNLQSCNCCVNAHFKHVPLEWGLSESDWWINQVEALWKGLLGTRLKFEKLWFRCEQASWKLTC